MGRLSLYCLGAQGLTGCGPQNRRKKQDTDFQMGQGKGDYLVDREEPKKKTTEKSRCPSVPAPGNRIREGRET